MLGETGEQDAFPSKSSSVIVSKSDSETCQMFIWDICQKYYILQYCASSSFTTLNAYCLDMYLVCQNTSADIELQTFKIRHKSDYPEFSFYLHQNFQVSSLHF